MTTISPFKKWLINNKLYTKDKNYTHLLLNGGKLHIPNEHYEDFLKKYTLDLISENPNFICESRNELFKFMIDLDFLENVSLGIEKIMFFVFKIINILQLIINDEKNIFSCYVCLTQPLEKDNRTSIKIKNGVHLIFPNLIVNKDIGLQIRNILVYYFKHTLNNYVNTDWSQIIDESIYKQNGLRMIGSSKIERCKNCKKNDDCKICNNTRKINQNRYYVPIFYVSKNIIKLLEFKNKSKYFELDYLKYLFNIEDFININTLLEFQKKINNDIITSNSNIFNKDIIIFKKHSSYFKILKKCSIRYYKESLVRFKNDLPLWVENVLKFNQNNNELISPILSTQQNKFFNKLSKKDTNVKVNKINKIINIDDDDGKKIVNYIKTCFPIYKNELFKDIYFFGNYYIISTLSHYCMNIKNEHTSNHIYFVINKTEIYQKCFSTNVNESQINGPCSNYKSNGKKLNNYMKNLLFKMIPSSPEYYSYNSSINNSPVSNNTNNISNTNSNTNSNSNNNSNSNSNNNINNNFIETLETKVKNLEKMQSNDKNKNNKKPIKKNNLNTQKNKYNINKLEELLITLQNK